MLARVLPSHHSVKSPRCRHWRKSAATRSARHLSPAAISTPSATHRFSLFRAGLESNPRRRQSLSVCVFFKSTCGLHKPLRGRRRLLFFPLFVLFPLFLMRRIIRLLLRSRLLRWSADIPLRPIILWVTLPRSRLNTDASKWSRS